MNALQISILVILTYACYRSMRRIAASNVKFKIKDICRPTQTLSETPYENPKKFGLNKRYKKMGTEKYTRFLDRVNRRFMPKIENRHVGIPTSTCSYHELYHDYQVRLNRFYSQLERAHDFQGEHGFGWVIGLSVGFFILALLWAFGWFAFGTIGRVALSFLGAKVVPTAPPSINPHLGDILFWVASVVLGIGSLVGLFSKTTPDLDPSQKYNTNEKNWTGIYFALNHVRMDDAEEAFVKQCWQRHHTSMKDYYMTSVDPQEFILELGLESVGNTSTWHHLWMVMVGAGFGGISAIVGILWLLVPVALIIDVFK